MIKLLQKKCVLWGVNVKAKQKIIAKFCMYIYNAHGCTIFGIHSVLF